MLAAVGLSKVIIDTAEKCQERDPRITPFEIHISADPSQLLFHPNAIEAEQSNVIKAHPTAAKPNLARDYFLVYNLQLFMTSSERRLPSET
jgi:hypothetical protein